jgi:hypothetical protein
MPSVTAIADVKPRPPEVGKPDPAFQAGFTEWRKSQPGYKALLARIAAGEARFGLYQAAGEAGVSEHELGKICSAAAILRDERRLACAKEYPELVTAKAELDSKLAASEAAFKLAASEGERERLKLEINELLGQRNAVLVRWGEGRAAAKALQAARDIGLV